MIINSSLARVSLIVRTRNRRTDPDPQRWPQAWIRNFRGAAVGLLCAAASTFAWSADLTFASNAVHSEPRSYRLDPARGAALDPVGSIDPERIASTLMTLLQLPSQSCRERAMAEGAQALLRDIGQSEGIQVRLDDLPQRAAALGPELRAEIYCNSGQTAPESGNVIAYLPGNPALPSWNLSFHLDTNQTRFDGMRRDGDLIRPAPGTPLGADDKAGLAIIAELLYAIRDHHLSHGDIRVVGVVAEEDTAAGAQLIDGTAFQGDIVVSIDGTDPNEIGRAAPTMYTGSLAVRTQTSHPADVHKKKTVSACAVGAHILHEAGFHPSGRPPAHPDVVLHAYFTSCGVDEGGRTPKGEPIAAYRYNSISPFWTAAWQLRSLEGPDRARSMVGEISATVDRICAEAARDRTPVRCEMTGTKRADLVGYVVPEGAPAVQLLGMGFVQARSGSVKVTARQFGGFNGNYIKERFGQEMLLLGTGADQIHTNEETVSVQGMARVARGLLSAMLLSYRYVRSE